MGAIIGIAVVIGILYLYYLLIKWMFVAVVPHLLVILTVVGMTLVPIVYTWNLFRTFGSSKSRSGASFTEILTDGGWRSLFWLPVLALLALMYLDAVSLLFYFLEERFYAISTAREVIRLSGIIVEHTTGQFTHGLSVKSVIIGAFVKSALVVPLVIFIRTLSNDVEDGKQPAKVQYFRGQGIEDIKSVVVGTWKDFIEWCFVRPYTALQVDSWDWAVVGWILAFTWPLVIGAALSLLLILVMSALMFVVMISLHMIGVGVTFVLSMYFSAMLFGIERVLIFVRSGYAKCPHANCHAKVPLPVFVCPSCGAQHDKLIPGRYGLITRVCTCGNKLSTLFWFGKRNLLMLCSNPECKKPLTTEVFGGNVHVPIYGGSNAGKTMFMMALTWHMMEKPLSSTRTSFINERDGTDYQNIWKREFESGVEREKTQELIPAAFLLSVQRKWGLPVSIYLYDPAGEALSDEGSLSGHRFLKYVDGYALLIDPFSLPSMVDGYHRSGGRTLPSRTSMEDPEQIINHVVNVLERQESLSRARSIPTRIAVVLTKADMPFVARELGIELSSQAYDAKWQESGQLQSAQIRAWLQANEPALLQLLETRFREVRFFAVSSLGHEVVKGAERPFQPKQVVEPFNWLLAKRAMLTNPFVTNFGVRLAEVSSVALIVGLFIGVPLLLFAVAASML